MADADPVTVADSPELSAYEARIGDTVVGVAMYKDRRGNRWFTHTEVADEAGGRGVGGALARTALDDSRARGLRVVPMCPFIAGWIARHPEYRDLVPDDRQVLLEPRG